MSIVSEAQAKIEEVDVLLMMMVETFRHGGQRATAEACCELIRGAPVSEVEKRLERLSRYVGAIDVVVDPNPSAPTNYRLNPVGAELLVIEVEGWVPCPREQLLRDSSLRSAQAGRLL